MTGVEIALIAGSVLSAAVGTVTAVTAANQQADQSSKRAAAARQQAQNSRTEATLKSDDIRRRANRIAGQQAAMAGAGGVDIAGSIVDNLADTQERAARDIFNVNWSADARADNLEASAANMEDQGQQGITNAWIGSGLKTVSSLGGSLLSTKSLFASGPTGIDAEIADWSKYGGGGVV